MRRSPIYSIFKMVNQQSTFLNQHGSVYPKCFMPKPLINKCYLILNSNQTKILYGFSTNDKKPVTKV